MTFPVNDYTQKDKQYIWKQSLSAPVEDIKTVLCLSRDADVAIKAHQDAGKNTVEVRAVIVLVPREKLADNPDAQKEILTLKEKVGVILRKDDKKTPTRDDDTMTVQTVRPRRTPQDIEVRLSVEVSMPAKLALRVISADGDTKANGLAGPIAIRTADGDVSVAECLDSLSITSADGDVNVVNCAGPLQLKTADGDVKVSKCSKAVAIQTADGDVTLEEVQAKVEVKVSDGDIRVSFAHGPMEDCSFASQDGDIAVVMPKMSDVAFDLKASEGEVHLNAPGFEGTQTEHAAVGKLNNGGPAIKARSQDGDLSIKLQ